MKFIVGQCYTFRAGVPAKHARCPSYIHTRDKWNMWFLRSRGKRLRFQIWTGEVVTLSRTAAQRFVVKEGK